MTRAKFICEAVTERTTLNGKTAKIELRPVTSGCEENKAFYASTPGGTIVLDIVNPEAAATFKPGAEYYVDFTPAA